MNETEQVKVYLVGGAVRDKLRGVAPKDYDYVVVGSSPEHMLSLGYKQVGKDFPVFLHPDTGDEYALARTERKTGTGHTGFTCEWEGVTLEEDLSRRDLTINSIAFDTSTGEYIDPFNGMGDIKKKILRETSEAFSEDPLRVLRVARFLARYPEFKVSDSLYCTCCETDITSLTKERVWLETEKALSCEQPSRYFNYLFDLVKDIFHFYTNMEYIPQRKDHHPEVYVKIHTDLVMDYAAKHYRDPEITFAALMHDAGKEISYEKYGNMLYHEKEGLPVIENFCNEWRVPKRYKELALLVCEYHTKVHGVLGRNDQQMSRPKSVMKLFTQTNAINKPERFEKILKTCTADSRGRGGTKEEIEMFNTKPYPQADYLRECLQAVLNVDTKSISKKMLANGKSGVMIGEAIRVARIDAIRGVQVLWKKK